MPHASAPDRKITPALTARSHLLSDAEAVAVCLEHYGVKAAAQRLAGEKDSNFHIISDLGDEYLLKVINSGEDPAVTNMHTLALQHVEKRDHGMPVQRVILNKCGVPESSVRVTSDDVRTARLVTYTKGELQRKSHQTSVQRFNVGVMLARLQLALADFRHEAEDHFSTWDMKNASTLAAMISDLSPSAARDELFVWIDRFASDVLPHVPSLRAQVVHNDLSSDNIVVDPSQTDTIVGIIDFGDMVRTPVLFDVAVAAAYQLTEAEDPFRAALEFVAGFHAKRPLEALEADLLFVSIVARMVIRITITEWRASRFPENSKYILRNTPQAWKQFHRLACISNEEATHAIAKALNL